MLPPASSLPQELTALKHWVGWKLEHREGSSQPTKVPYNLQTGHKAANNKPEHWTTYPDSLSDSYSGIGFVFTKDLGMTGIDLDDCITDSGAIKPWAVEILANFEGTYAEVSPSGSGIKLWVRGSLPGTGAKAYIDEDGTRTVQSMNDGAVEMYDTGRYFCVTGQRYVADQNCVMGQSYATGQNCVTGQSYADHGESVTVLDLQEEITKLYNWLRGDQGGPNPAADISSSVLARGDVVTEGSRHAHLLSLAGKLRNQGFERGDLLPTIRQANASRCSPPKPDGEIIGIVEYVCQFPPKYRLTPRDYEVSRGYKAGQPASGPAPNVQVSGGGKAAGGQANIQASGGGLAALIPTSQPVPAPVPPPPPPPPAAPATILELAENLLAAAIASKDPMQVLGIGTQPSSLICALAQAGSIKQFEARRRIKDAFGVEVPLRELDARIKAAEPVLDSAPSPYILTSEGGMVANLANAITMLDKIPMQYNSFSHRVFLAEPAPWGTAGDWGDYDDTKAAEWCQRQNLNIGRVIASEAADAVARARPHYHPVLEYLQSQRWDGEPRIDEWLIRYMGCENTPYVRAVSAKWLMSGCKRIVDPNTPGVRGEHWNQADYTLVLEGGQGKKKSTALRSLCPLWFSDDIGKEVGTPDSALGLQGKWIVEIAELSAFRRSDWETIKAWLVRREDHYRRPYARRSEDFPRQNIFAASTNKRDWLTDDTGGRRFWPVKVGELDLEGLASVRDQLWAEAFFRFHEGEATWLSEDLERQAGEEQHERQDVDLWTDTVEAWIQNPQPRVAGSSMRSWRNEIYLSDVLVNALGLEEKSLTGLQKVRVGRILRLAGYETKRAARDKNDPKSKRPEYWCKTEG